MTIMYSTGANARKPTRQIRPQMLSIPGTSRPSTVIAACAALLLSLAACSDSTSTGPSTIVDANGALQSLQLGLGANGASSVFGPSTNTLVSVGPQLASINVTIDGKTQSMFALGLRETYPAGTCVENLIVTSNPPGTCTPPPLGIALILWQSHSAKQPPDRLALIFGNTGTNDFALDDLAEFPPVALYFEGFDIWGSISGTLTSNVSATSQACAVPLPIFAKSGSCSFATFDEEGTIDLEGFSAGAQPRTLVIPRQTILGIWQTITETRPVPFG